MRNMSNAVPAKLFHKLRQVCRIRAVVLIDLTPCNCSRAFDILRAFTLVNPLRIPQIDKQMPIGAGAFVLLV